MLGESPKRISLILISIVHSFIFQNSDSISLGRVISAGKFKEGTLWNHQCSKSGRMWRNRRRVEKNRLQKSSKWNESVSHSAMPYSLRPWAAPHQVPPSMGFSRQGYWSSLPFPSPGDLPDPGIEPRSLALQADSLPTELPGSPVVGRMIARQGCPSLNPWNVWVLGKGTPRLQMELKLLITWPPDTEIISDYQVSPI